ncbi:profilin [Angomonas deanei]|uniref:Profilin n=1 Tax=Angomonas deanei TaxID=59799 RepID=S9UG13_9TRYP|nr:profilin [Angomonas deanei]EPY43303.1 profilin [Angomonas deanei]CAD2216395.1 Profilin, putative [Angomonas deanei]|eukprot:EPY27654.1 profilin [Angomonas deanei]
MSWQAYIDDSLIASGFMHSAAIVSLADGSYWAYGGTAIPQPAEVKHILQILNDLTLVQSSGVTVGGVKYFGLQSGNDGESKYFFFKKGAAGGCVYTTKQAFIIGVYGNPGDASSLDSELHKSSAKADVPVNPADCNATVKRIADYLIKLGY